MKMNIKFSAISGVMETLEQEIENVKEWLASSTEEYESKLSQLNEEEQDSSEEDRAYRLKNDWSLNRSKEKCEENEAKLQILEHLNDYLYNNFQKIFK